MAYRTRLEEYLITNEVLASELSRLTDINPGQLSHYVAGNRCPTIGVALAIETHTGGAVPVSSWAGLTGRPKRRRRQKVRVA